MRLWPSAAARSCLGRAGANLHAAERQTAGRRAAGRRRAGRGERNGRLPGGARGPCRHNYTPSNSQVHILDS